MKNKLLAIDLGTTSTRTILFSKNGQIEKIYKEPISQYFPKEGWVEHDAWEILTKTITIIKKILKEHSKEIAAIGITNQRETTIVWEKATGKPICKAIVWQDRRTAPLCKKLINDGLAEMIQLKTGLVLDPYFSATKISWILDNVPRARQQADNGQLLFGTVDSFVLWHLTDGAMHATDASNASRTMLYNIFTNSFDEELLHCFNIPKNMLPKVLDSASNFGTTKVNILDYEIPITAVIGDQQGALIGQACLKPGMIKSTYGTGCFMMANTGDKPLQSKNKLLTTIAYRLNGKTTYAIEGSIFMAGAIVQWLRDQLNIIAEAKDTEEIFAKTVNNCGVYLVPAFTGLGAPFWQPKARAAILGMTRGTNSHHIVRASLEAVAYQSLDLLNAMKQDGIANISSLRVDGGMVANNHFVQFLADILALQIDRTTTTEVTALGAVMLAGIQVGIFSSLEDAAKIWKLDTSFIPTMLESEKEALYNGWLKAVSSVCEPIDTTQKLNS